MDDLILDFLHFLQVEKGLSTNTLVAYERDLRYFVHYLEEEQGAMNIRDVERIHIVSFMAYAKLEGKSPRTIARYIASLRSFFHFLLHEKIANRDPMIQIETPKQAQVLPKILNLDDVEKLLEAPNASNPLGMRDRAMLEVLYATGLRVTELVRLQLDDLHLEMGFIQTIGKGDKERIIPLGKTATTVLERYLEFGRPRLRRASERNDVVFFEPSWMWNDTTRFLEKFETHCV